MLLCLARVGTVEGDKSSFLFFFFVLFLYRRLEGIKCMTERACKAGVWRE